MNAYSKTIIYKLWSDNLPPDQIYWGHTTQTIEERLTEHELKSNKCVSRRIIEAGSYHIEEVAVYDCKDKREALWHERWWIENNPHVNKYLPIRSEEEKVAYLKKWQETNRLIQNEKMRQKRLNNIDEMRQHEREQYAKHAEKNRANAKKYRSENPEKCKQSNQDSYAKHADARREYAQGYRKENQTEISGKEATRITCPDCNKEMNRNCLSRHKLDSCKGVPIVFKTPRVLCVMCNTEQTKNSIARHRKQCLAKCCNEIMNVCV
jgi:hypothetical protein